MKTPEQLAIEAAHWTTLGYMHRAVACHIQRVNGYRRQGDRVNEAEALVQLGRGYDVLGNVDEAIESCERSLALAREIGDLPIESSALVALGLAYGHLGYASRTRAYGEQALHIARAGNRQHELAALASLGHAHLWFGEREDALERYQQSLSIAVDLDNAYERGTMLEYLGLAHMAGGDEGHAIDCYMQGLSILSRINAIYTSGRIVAHLADAYTRTNRLMEAAQALSQARLIFHEVHMYRGFTLLAGYMANFYRQQGRFEEAQRSYKRAITLCDDVQDRYGQAQCLLEYARLLREHKHEQDALKIAGYAQAIYRERGTEEQVEKVRRWMEELVILSAAKDLPLPGSDSLDM